MFVQGKEVKEGDTVYGVTSAPDHGKWGPYFHAVGYQVQKTADGQGFKLVNTWTAKDHTSVAMCWKDAKRQSESAKPLASGGKRILLTEKGLPKFDAPKAA